MPTLPLTAIIGAGSSGIAAAKALHERGMAFDCYEASDRVGGNWVFGNRNGMSAAYRDLYINTSRDRMQFSDFPMPESYPDFPHHTQIAAYFEDYVEHFGFRDRIRFETTITQARQRRDGSWELTDSHGVSRDYDMLVVANGHHWDQRWPEPAFPGSDAFEGIQMHAHEYRDNTSLAGKDVVVLGMGNSAMDIAVESSHVARSTHLAARRGAWIVPKYLFGRPLDQISTLPHVPYRLQARVSELIIRLHVGRPERYGLPRPDHRFGQAHPTVSGRILDRVIHGAITPRPNIARLGPDWVQFADGERVHADVVIYCTGYRISFPFFDEGVLATSDNRVDLYRRVFAPRQSEPRVRRPAAAGRRDHAAGRGAVAVDRRLPARRVPAAADACDAGGDRARDASGCVSAMSPRSATRSRSTSTRTGSTCGASAGAGRGGRRRRAARCRCPVAWRRRSRRMRRMRRAHDEHRRGTSGGGRRHGRASRGDEDGEPRRDPRRRARGVRRARLRRHERARRHPPHGPRQRHVLQLLPRQGVAVSRGRRAERREGARARAGRPPRGRSLEEFVAASFREYFAFLADDPDGFTLMQRNSGTIRAMFDEPIFGAGVDELAADLRTAIDSGLVPPVDAGYVAAAMVGAALEVGVAMIQRDPPDVEGATRFATACSSAGSSASRGTGARRRHAAGARPRLAGRRAGRETVGRCRPSDPSRRRRSSSRRRSRPSGRALAFLVHRDADGEQQIVTLADEAVWVGRRDTVGLCLAWDAQVSGVHAELEPSGGEWTLVDDGLSRNGSFVNGERVNGRRRLRDRDMLRFGRTVVLFRAPADAGGQQSTIMADDGLLVAASLSETQRKVLIALCRPFKDGATHATPATNQQIADELFLSVQAVKAHLRALFEKFGVEDLAQNSKRAALVQRALGSGLISNRDLGLVEPMCDEPQIGAEIGGYRLESVIARGGMGVVYLAEDVRMGRTVALKILPGELAENERFRARFLHESRVAGAVNHPNVIPVYDAGESDGLLYISMRYVEGTDLRGLLRTDGPLDLQRAVSIISQAASALAATHQRGLIHRDVKPANMLLVPRTSQDGADHVYLSDFGLAKNLGSLSGLTKTGQFMGTVGYVAPEQIRGKGVDKRTDVYALGCVLFECLTGSQPFRAQGRLRDDHGPRQRRAAARLRAAARRAGGGRRRRGDGRWPRMPDDRFASCDELGAALRRAAGAQTGPTPTPAAAPGAPTAPSVEGLGVVRRRGRGIARRARSRTSSRPRPSRSPRTPAPPPAPAPLEGGETVWEDEIAPPVRRTRRAAAAAAVRARRARRARRAEAARAGSRSARACCSASSRWAASSRSAVVLLGGGDDDEPTATTPPAVAAAPPNAGPAQDSSAWGVKASSPSARQQVATAVLGGKISLIGGLVGKETATATAEVESYDPAIDTWNTQTSLPRPLHHAAAVGYRGELVVIGGWEPEGSNLLATTSREVLALRDGRWVRLASLRHPRAAAAAAVVDDQIVVVGGQADNALVPVTEIFDGTKWRDAAPLPTPREHLAAASDGRFVYAVGGRKRSSDRNTVALERYDAKADSWKKLTGMPVATGSMGTAIVNGRLVVVGGEGPSQVIKNVQSYDLASGRWSQLGAMRTPRHGLGVAAFGTTLYALDGARATGHTASTNVAEALDLG